ncbi:transporter [Mariprofundus ferrooxydans]|nr:transporter [Mariprofundus ferrooxydans]
MMDYFLGQLTSAIKNSVIFSLLLVFSLLTTGQAFAAKVDQPTISVSAVPSFFTGTFGTNTTTNITYIPTYIKYKLHNMSLKLTVPYIIVQSNGAAVSGGTVIGTGKGVSRTSSGLGDIWLEGKYTLHHVFDSSFNVIPYGKIKFATASKAKGLGTGENDIELGMGVRTRISSQWFPFARLGYRFVGQPAGRVLNDILTYRSGVSYALDRENVFTVMFSGREASQPGFSNAADMIVAWNYKLKKNMGLQLFGDKGLSNGSPNYGVGAGFSYRF